MEKSTGGNTLQRLQFCKVAMRTFGRAQILRWTGNMLRWTSHSDVSLSQDSYFIVIKRAFSEKRKSGNLSELQQDLLTPSICTPETFKLCS